MGCLKRRGAALVCGAVAVATVGTGCCGGSDDGVAMTADGAGNVTEQVPGTLPHPTAPLVIEESDLVKLEGTTLYVHNARTGLHVVDVAEPRAPVRIGQLPELAGAPGELYAHPDQALVLLDGPVGLCATRSALVSVAAPNTPEVRVGDANCRSGALVSSRLVGDVLYVVESGADVGSAWTQVASFDVAVPGVIAPLEDERFPGTGVELLLTERAIYVTQSSPSGGTRVQYVDISAGDGSLVARDSIDVVGAPMGRFHMSEYADTFRIVTRVGFDLEAQTELTVIDVRDPDHLATLGALSGLAPGEVLFATRFVDDRAYIVTYQPQVTVNNVVVNGYDPLFIISLEDPTAPFVMSELQIPGWSDYIFPRGDRLLAVGRGDQGRGVAASLFDVSDPYAPSELKRLEFGAATATSEANSDFRGVTVLEGAPGEVPLVIVPFTNNIGVEPNCRPEHHVQLIELFDADLGLAGELGQPGRVRRTLPVADTLYVVSDRAVAAADVSQRFAPETIGRVVLDDTTRTDTCEFPPAAPETVIVNWVTPDEDEEDLTPFPQPCSCSTTTRPTPCFGTLFGFAALLGLAGVGVRMSLRWRARRGAPRGN